MFSHKKCIPNITGLIGWIVKKSFFAKTNSKIPNEINKGLFLRLVFKIPIDSKFLFFVKIQTIKKTLQEKGFYKYQKIVNIFRTMFLRKLFFTKISAQFLVFYVFLNYSETPNEKILFFFFWILLRCWEEKKTQILIKKSLRFKTWINVLNFYFNPIFFWFCFVGFFFWSFEKFQFLGFFNFFKKLFYKMNFLEFKISSINFQFVKTISNILRVLKTKGICGRIFSLNVLRKIFFGKFFYQLLGHLYKKLLPLHSSLIFSLKTKEVIYYYGKAFQKPFIVLDSEKNIEIFEKKISGSTEINFLCFNTKFEKNLPLINERKGLGSIENTNRCNTDNFSLQKNESKWFLKKNFLNYKRLNPFGKSGSKFLNFRIIVFLFRKIYEWKNQLIHIWIFKFLVVIFSRDLRGFYFYINWFKKIVWDKKFHLFKISVNFFKFIIKKRFFFNLNLKKNPPFFKKFLRLSHVPSQYSFLLIQKKKKEINKHFFNKTFFFKKKTYNFLFREKPGQTLSILIFLNLYSISQKKKLEKLFFFYWNFFQWILFKKIYQISIFK